MMQDVLDGARLFFFVWALMLAGMRWGASSRYVSFSAGVYEHCVLTLLAAN